MEISKKFHFLYKTICLISNRFYIGIHSTNDLNDGYLGSGKLLMRSVRKHGAKNHKLTILAFADSRAEVSELEKIAVSSDLLSDPLCLNICLGGDGGNGWTEESRLKGIQTFKANMANSLYAKAYRERRAKAREANPQGFLIAQAMAAQSAQSEQAKEKRFATYRENAHQQGEKNSQFGTCWITKDGSNKKIPKGELEKHLSLGWTRGRNLPMLRKPEVYGPHLPIIKEQRKLPDELKAKLSLAHKQKGLSWYSNLETETSLRFSANEVPEGWVKGRKFGLAYRSQLQSSKTKTD